ncbi:helix-turn-helix domain-containing protein [Streptomyces sp. NPDC093089]|uniref:AraC family transcriptional regulator n=1 Tax=Streptomyces sp. NPDC093089 TaxID=3366024 RepID=UPI00381BCF26
MAGTVPTHFQTSDPELAREFLLQAFSNAPHMRLAGAAAGKPIVSFAQAGAGPIGTSEIAQAATLPARLLAEVAPLPAQSRHKPLRLLTRAPVDEAAAELWKSTSAYVATVLADPHTARSPLLIGSASRLMAATVLTVFRTTLTSGPTLADGSDATPDTVRRAVAFIEDDADQDIGLAHIAAACVTPRAVQYAFRGHLDTTPLPYLRQVRLEYAHQDLLAADPNATTVTAIAVRWGFGHHFAQHHRASYQVAPSTTLRRRP